MKPYFEKNITHTQVKQTAFTLVELLIAMFLGLFITGIVITIFLGAKQSFRASTEISRSQENTNFAMSFLTRNLRMAGYSTCTDGVSVRNFINQGADTYSPSVITGVAGWDYAGTGLGDIATTFDLNYQTLNLTQPFTQADLDAVRTANAGARNDWTNGSGNLPQVITDLQPIVGSDILVISIATPVDSKNLHENNNQTISTLDLIDSDGNAIASEIEQGQVIKVGDCAALDVFHNQADTGDEFISAGTVNETGNSDGNQVNAAFRWQKPWNPNAEIFTVETIVYYIGTGSNGAPSLYSFTSNCGLNPACPGAVSTELVEGVENMQILYGTGRALDDSISNITYASGDTINDFEPIANLKLGLLMRSPGQGRERNVGNTNLNINTNVNTLTLFNSMQINAPDDRNIRFVNNVTIGIGNKGS